MDDTERRNQIIQQEDVAHALGIRRFILERGGAATKSAIEDVLLISRGMKREPAHMLLNRIEYHNIHHRHGPEYTVEDMRPIMADVKIDWYEGDPFAA